MKVLQNWQADEPAAEFFVQHDIHIFRKIPLIEPKLANQQIRFDFLAHRIELGSSSLFREYAFTEGAAETVAESRVDHDLIEAFPYNPIELEVRPKGTETSISNFIAAAAPRR